MARRGLRRRPGPAAAGGPDRRLGAHDSPGGRRRGDGGGAVQATQDELGAEIRAAVTDGVDRIGIEAEFLEREGNPYKELIAVAHDLRVDAIVVGASMQAGHRIVGSLAARLVRDAAWPITVVP